MLLWIPPPRKCYHYCTSISVSLLQSSQHTSLPDMSYTVSRQFCEQVSILVTERVVSFVHTQAALYVELLAAQKTQQERVALMLVSSALTLQSLSQLEQRLAPPRGRFVELLGRYYGKLGGKSVLGELLQFLGHGALQLTAA